MAARLLAATGSAKPVLLDLDLESGHGIGDTRTQRQQRTAKVYAFLLWQMGHPDFQPAKR
jgi:prolyl oligopeptidase